MRTKYDLQVIRKKTYHNQSINQSVCYGYQMSAAAALNNHLHHELTAAGPLLMQVKYFQNQTIL